MRICVIGDSILDIECSGGWDGNLPENPEVSIFRAGRPHIYAGGAANVTTILTGQRVSVDLVTNGPGPKHEAWIVDLLKKTTRANRIIFTNQGNVPVKFRGLGPDHRVLSRIDAEDSLPYTMPCPALESVRDDVRAGKYDGVLVSDYRKGMICPHTEQVISDILKAIRWSAIDSKSFNCQNLWKHATCLTPNRAEAYAIYGTDDPCVIRDLVGCKFVLVTRGLESVLLGCQDGMTEISVDPQDEAPYIIGAGDSFAAGVIVALCQGRSYIEAGMAGVKLASEYVRKGRKPVLR